MLFVRLVDFPTRYSGNTGLGTLNAGTCTNLDNSGVDESGTQSFVFDLGCEPAFVSGLTLLNTDTERFSA